MAEVLHADQSGEPEVARIFSIKFDTSSLDMALECLAALFPKLSNALLEVVYGFLRAVETGHQALFVQRDNCLTSGTGEMIIFLDPSDALVGLCAALGAGDV